MSKLRSNDEGFTLIELLVVILIIGILAAIALPTFLGQRDKAQDSSAKSDVRNSVTQVESCLVDAKIDACDTAAEAGFPTRVTMSGTNAAGTYTLSADSDSGTTFRIIKAAPGTYTRECGKTTNGTFAKATSASGGCKADGSW